MGKKGFLMKKTTKATSDFDNVNVTATCGFDSVVAGAVRRRTRFETKNDNLVTESKYSIDGQLFTVRSFFRKDEKKTPADIIQRVIDSDIVRNDKSL